MRRFTVCSSRLAALAAALLLFVPTDSGSARAAVRSIDGCPLLAQGFADAAVALFGDALPRPSRLAIRETRPGGGTARLRCHATAATASAAFGRALRAGGVDVGWAGGESCVGGDLDRCVPRIRRILSAPDAANAARVASRWRLLAGALRCLMPFGTRADVADFSPAELAAALAAGTARTPRVWPVASGPAPRSATRCSAPFRQKLRRKCSMAV